MIQQADLMLSGCQCTTRDVVLCLCQLQDPGALATAKIVQSLTIVQQGLKVH